MLCLWLGVEEPGGSLRGGMKRKRLKCGGFRSFFIKVEIV